MSQRAFIYNNSKLIQFDFQRIDYEDEESELDLRIELSQANERIPTCAHGTLALLAESVAAETAAEMDM